jgi:hypothetical protein
MWHDDCIYFTTCYEHWVYVLSGALFSDITLYDMFATEVIGNCK